MRSSHATFEASLDAELGAIASKNVAAAKRAGGIRQLKTSLRDELQTELSEAHISNIDVLKAKLRTMTDERNTWRGMYSRAHCELRRRAAFNADMKLNAYNDELQHRLGVSEEKVLELENKLLLLHAELERRPAERTLLKCRRVGNVGKKGSHSAYPDYFPAVAMECLSSGASSTQIRRLLRTFQCTWLPELGYEDFMIPEENWWNQIRGQMSTAEQAMAGMQYANAESDAQTGFDESEIDRAETINVATRPIDASGQSISLLLAACHVQPGATAQAVSVGITGIYEQAQQKVDAVREAVAARA